MSTLFIESEANPKFKRWKRLALEPRAVKREGAALLEGAHLLGAALEREEVRLSAVILRSGGVTQEACELAETARRERNARVFELPQRLFDVLSPVENGVGVMCEIALPQAALPESWKRLNALYLDGIQDSGNAGTLIRTAAAAGVGVVVAGPGTAGLWTPRVLRAAMGGHFALKLVEGMTAADFRAQYEGRMLAADARGGSNLFEASDYTERGPICWMMGAEGPGLSEEALALADERYWIPISSKVESLNVAAAAAVCLFDSARRRLARQDQSR